MIINPVQPAATIVAGFANCPVTAPFALIFACSVRYRAPFHDQRVPMSVLSLYTRAIMMLRLQKGLALLLAVASFAIAIVQLAEPVLFGRVVDELSKGREASSIIAVWAALGLGSVGASVIVSVYADRLAHTLRLSAMERAFERANTLPLSYHAAKGSGAVVRNILAGTDALFWLWLGALRDQLTAIAGIVFLVPAAIGMDWRMSVILAASASFAQRV